MADVPVAVTGTLPTTVVPVWLDSLVDHMVTASAVETDSRDGAGAGFEHDASIAASTIPAQPNPQPNL